MSGRSVVFLVDGINDEMIDRSIESIINVNMLPYFDIYVCPNYNTLFLEKTSKFVKSVSRLCENARIGLKYEYKVFTGKIRKCISQYYPCEYGI